jgi:hypothetical protein
MKASIIHFEILGKSEVIYCYSYETNSVKKKLNEEINKITTTAFISSTGENLDVPDDIILNNSLNKWIDKNQKFLK